MKKNLTLILAVILLYFSFCAFQCRKDDDKGKPDSCNDVACTMDFRMITFQIVDTTNSVVIDRTETVLNGSVINGTQGQPNLPDGSYTVVDDGNMDVLKFRVESEVLVRLFSNGVVVKEVAYVVSRDCCHVFKVSGPEVIYL